MVTEYHLTYFIQLSEQSKTQCNFNAKQRKGKKFLTPLVDTAVLTLTDWAPLETRKRCMDIGLSNFKSWLSGKPVNTIY